MSLFSVVCRVKNVALTNIYTHFFMLCLLLDERACCLFEVE